MALRVPSSPSRVCAVGERQALLGDDDDVVAIVKITCVETHALRDVPWEFADAEGEGFESIEHWRTGHVSYYEKHGVTVNDDTRFVCVWFRVIENSTAS